MVALEDELFLYRLFYRRYLDNPIQLVDGNFFHYKRNLILSYTLEEMADYLHGSTVSLRYNGEERAVCIRRCGYDIPGANYIDASTQIIPYSGYYNQDYYDNDDDFIICFVADLKNTEEKTPSFRDYEFSFQLLGRTDVEMCKRSFQFHIRTDTVEKGMTISAEKYLFNKNHDFKSRLNIPLGALPKVSGMAPVPENVLMLPVEDLNWNNATGMGVNSGGNNGYRCLDIDGCDSDSFISSFLKNLGLEYDYPWVVKTGSGNGFHIWIMCDDDISYELLLKDEALRIFKDYGVLYFKPKNEYEYTFRVIELRWNSFCMLPPSLGPNGKKYEFCGDLPKQKMEKVSFSKLMETICLVADNTSIKYDVIVHRHYFNGCFSLSEETETMFLCFDTETTGLPSNYNANYTDTFNWPRIVQLSYIIFTVQDNDIKVLKKNDFILAPDDSFSIPASSTKVHGISDAMARKNGYDRKTILQTFALQLKEVDYLVGHNVDFDINVLRAEFVREGIDDKCQFNHIKKLCTMKSAMPLYPSGSHWPKLETLYHKLTGKVMSGAHNSMNDAEATLTCFKKLVRAGYIEIEQTINYNSLDDPSNRW